MANKKTQSNWKCRKVGKGLICKKGRKEVQLDGGELVAYGFKNIAKCSAKDDTTGKITKFVRVN